MRLKEDTMQYFVLVVLQINWYIQEDKKHVFLHLKYYAIAHEFCMAMDSKSQHIKEKLDFLNMTTECWFKPQTAFLSAINTPVTAINTFLFSFYF